MLIGGVEDVDRRLPTSGRSLLPRSGGQGRQKGLEVKVVNSEKDETNEKSDDGQRFTPSTRSSVQVSYGEEAGDNTQAGARASTADQA
ncbi:hypothetical protein C0Q70_08590 [Pomacea canaliculata]|uniref:Uncharacterized protein n=1 Tax=Pomacea canaliculata TaxID=400727 RepID=A0A2T7PI86_POMCA|nr:hypothetical protein C0Q70_08590 [Pomacea canaliculata]